MADRATKIGGATLILEAGLGVYQSAWHMVHRIRYGLSQEPLRSKLQGRLGRRDLCERQASADVWRDGEARPGHQV